MNGLRLPLLSLFAAIILAASPAAAGAPAARAAPARPAPAAPSDPASPLASTLGRDEDPVIITGRDVSLLLGLPAGDFRAYRYASGAWIQIPVQVDEVTLAGAYAAREDGVLDENDEIVFMAGDAGEKASKLARYYFNGASRPGLYEIEVIDPDAPEHRGWVYLVYSNGLTPPAPQDYVGFQPGYHRIVSANYSLGLSATQPGADYLAIGPNKLEVLDRTKIRVFCHLPFVCPLTEDSLEPLPDQLVKDGPVRVILRGGDLLAYESMIRWTTAYTIPQILEGSIRVSTDFSKDATGGLLYNEAVVLPVLVDGRADFVPAEPASRWWQLSTLAGTIYQVADTFGMGGYQANYYSDDSSWNASDTGDRCRYGETGTSIDQPNLAFNYTFAFYFRPGLQPNAGSRYVGQFDNPLAVEPIFFEVPEHDFLPGVTR